MSSRLSIYLKKKLLRKDQNLISVEEPFAVMQRLLEGRSVSTILDIGASNGSVSRRLLQHFPQAALYGFEPNPLYREMLMEYAHRDGRFRPQFVAVGEREGNVTLRVAASPGNTSLYSPGERLKAYDAAGAVIHTEQEVPLVCIDDWAQRQQLAAIEVMKFDIQGGELKAMEGAAEVLRSSTLAIYTEVLFNSLYEGGAVFSDIDRFLRSCGFVLYDLYKPKYDPNGLLLWGNAVFVHAGRLGI